MTDTDDVPNPYEGSEFWRFREALAFHVRLREAMLDTNLVWVVGSEFMPGATEAYGLPIKRAEGLDRVYLAHDLTPDGD